MNTARQILNRLTALGARVERSGDRVVLYAGQRPVPGGLVEQARAIKPDLLRLLACAPTGHPKALKIPEDVQTKSLSTFGGNEHLRTLVPTPLEAPDGCGDQQEERAAIVDDSGVPRAWAEGLARLDSMAPPAGVPAHRWRRLIDNAGRFIDRWAAKAAALGWDTPSVFGCHPEVPGRRFDLQGLLWCVGDGELVGITAATATIRSVNGFLLTYRRAPAPPGERVAAIWELEPVPVERRQA